MNTAVTSAIVGAAVRAGAAGAVPGYDLPNPTPDSGFIGVAAGMSLYNGIYVLVMIGAGIAFLAGCGLAGFGKLAKHSGAFEGGLWTVGCAVGVAALASGAGAIITFGSHIKVI